MVRWNRKTYQGHRGEINRCGSLGRLETLSQVLKLLRRMGGELCPDRMPSWCTGPQDH
jgi:hypothetical protein